MHKPRLLSDNGSSYISSDPAEPALCASVVLGDASKSLASVTAIGSVTVLDPPAAVTVSVSVPTVAFFGTSSRLIVALLYAVSQPCKVQRKNST